MSPVSTSDCLHPIMVCQRVEPWNSTHGTGGCWLICVFPSPPERKVTHICISDVAAPPSVGCYSSCKEGRGRVATLLGLAGIYRE